MRGYFVKIGLCFVLVFAYVSPFSDFAIGVKTYFKSLGMSKAELRQEVIRNYIYLKWLAFHDLGDFGKNHNVILIPRHLSNQDIIQAINRGNILSYLKENPIFIKRKKDVDKLDSKILSGDLMVAVYNKRDRTLSLVPTKSMRQIGYDEFDDFYKNHKNRKSKFMVSDRERMRGFGKNFFLIQFEINIDLACCDGGKNYRGETPEIIKMRNVNTVERSKMSMLVVSSSGDILEREYDGINFIHF